ncbi:MAG: tRNA modification GTPase MnmE [Planctomycetaceae bacterium]|nr:MAG: tRNA modification GTPase MnmE [Planctomycetaceae bacterium]
MNVCWDDCIAAIASPPGVGWRGIIRLTGPQLRLMLDKVLTRRSFDPHKPSRSLRLHLDRHREGMTDATWLATSHPSRQTCGVKLDSEEVDVELLWWPTSRSYTGQPLAEIHLDSSPLLEEVLHICLQAGARLARPGEFTLRAFLTGKIDLLQAEAVVGVIDAEDQLTLQTALDQLAGGLSQDLRRLRAILLDLLADVEAGLDFVDEHIEFVSRLEINARLAQVRRAVEDYLRHAHERSTRTEGWKVVLAGLPNAGKSTLFNRLIGDDEALVSPWAGTTRDYLTQRVTWQQCSLLLVDTAGIIDEVGIHKIARDTSEPGLGLHQLEILAETQQMARAMYGQADLIVWCTASDLTQDQRALDESARAEALQDNPNLLWIQTKAELTPVHRSTSTPARDNQQLSRISGQPIALQPEMNVSAHTGEGINELKDLIVTRIFGLQQARAGRHWATARCRDSLVHALAALQRAEALAATEFEANDELLALEIRETLAHLGSITGEVYDTELLDRIFSRFCIGK